MDGISTIVTAAVSVVVAWYGSLEWRLRNMNNRINKAMNREDTEKLIDLKQEALHTLQKEIKDDIRDLNRKLDKLIER